MNDNTSTVGLAGLACSCCWCPTERWNPYAIEIICQECTLWYLRQMVKLKKIYRRLPSSRWKL